MLNRAKRNDVKIDATPIYPAAMMWHPRGTPEACRWQYRLGRFSFIFHGGEPLLAGDDFLAFFVDAARRRLAPAIRPDFAIQTNGTLLTEARARTLRQLEVRVGISMDGTAASHDRWRVDHRGRGSYARVCAGLHAASE